MLCRRPEGLLENQPRHFGEEANPPLFHLLRNPLSMTRNWLFFYSEHGENSWVRPAESAEYQRGSKSMGAVSQRTRSAGLDGRAPLEATHQKADWEKRKKGANCGEAG